VASTTRLCERLPHDGNDVLCVDNYFTGRKDNNADLLGDPHFEAMRHDVTLPPYVEIDEVYNLACPASPVHFQYDPVQTTKTSVIGAINMLGLAKQVGAKFLQASTSEVYGDPTVHPQTEEYRDNVLVMLSIGRRYRSTPMAPSATSVSMSPSARSVVVLAVSMAATAATHSSD
jgi:nucleoside-diphosphate-sugar epimerase